MSKIKPILVNLVLLSGLLFLAVVFVRGFDYYSVKYQQKIDEVVIKGDIAAPLVAQKKDDPYHLSALLLGEMDVDSAGNTKWGDLYFLAEDNQRVLLAEPKQEATPLFDPVASRDRLFYYTLNRSEGREVMTLRSLTLASGRDEIVAAPGRDYEIRGGWLSADGEQLIYQKVNQANGESAFWGHDLKKNLVEELMIPEAGLYPTPTQQWGANSEQFYFTKNVGLDSYVLYEARGSVITTAFPAFNWSQVDWRDMWQVKPLAVSPDGLSAVYLDRQLEGEQVVTTDINIIDQSGGKTNLLTVSGNVYEIAWSPDGRRVAFNVATHDSTGQRNKAELWVIESSGDNPAAIHQAAEVGAMLYDLHWDRRGEKIFFGERLPHFYSLIQTVDWQREKVDVLERHLAGREGDSYLRLLQYQDMPKALDWQEK